MISIRTILSVLLVAPIAAVASASVTTQNNYFADDTAFNDAYGGSGSDFEAFATEGRVGNNATNGDIETQIILGDGTGLTFGTASGQYKWGNEVSAVNQFTADFTLEYSGGLDKLVTWTIGGVQISDNSNLGSITDLLIRTRSRNNDSTTSSIVIDNLVLDGHSLGSAESRADDIDDVDYLLITDYDFNQGFTLTGDATLTWAGVRPSGSQLAFQIKAMQAIPEPASALILALAAPGVYVVRRHLRNRAKA